MNSGIAILGLMGKNIQTTWLVKKERAKNSISNEGREVVGGEKGLCM